MVCNDIPDQVNHEKVGHLQALKSGYQAQYLLGKMQVLPVEHKMEIELHNFVHDKQGCGQPK